MSVCAASLEKTRNPFSDPSLIITSLVSFILNERGIPRKDYVIADADGNEIGVVTSGTQSPSTGKAIGLGYVKTEFSKPETEIFIQIRKKTIPAKVVKPPFYKG